MNIFLDLLADHSAEARPSDEIEPDPFIDDPDELAECGFPDWDARDEERLMAREEMN